MNKTFANQEHYISNKRIIDAYFNEADMPVSPAKKVANWIASVLYAIIHALTCAKAARLTKVFVIVACFVGFVGIIGAMERGTLSLALGLFLSALILAIEYRCLKKCAKKQKRI